MQTFIQKYLKILAIELDDLESDIKFLIEKYKQKKDSETISNYVFLENLVVLNSELCGISSFKKLMNEFDPASYATIEDFLDGIKARFKRKIIECGLPEGIYMIIERKLIKVYTYVGQID
ncbi:MAG: hypothetical protein JW881_00600 [Spirochaetales bacterium]|nr:hypothetical protein [Spirochaetales bacterium]